MLARLGNLISLGVAGVCLFGCASHQTPHLKNIDRAEAVRVIEAVRSYFLHTPKPLCFPVWANMEFPSEVTEFARSMAISNVVYAERWSDGHSSVILLKHGTDDRYGLDVDEGGGGCAFELNRVME